VFIKKNFMRLLFFTLASLFFHTANAQWNADPSINNAVCNFTGNQTNAQVVADGTGGTITVWQDTRNGSTDIYAQRISATGTLLWAVDGVPLCNAAFDQQNPKIVTDGSGGAVIAWIDDRNGGGAGNYDIYAQRINANGIVQWPADGVPVCTATGIQNNQQLLADNSGAIIVWSDGRGGSSNADIYAQRLNQVGTALWAAEGMQVCGASSLQNMPQIISDGGAGSAIITWEDWRNFSQSDIYAQKISNGFTDWAFNGVVICSEPSFAHQYNTKMVADGSGGAVICWEDKRNAGTNTDLYAQRVNNSGITQWASNGIAICNAGGIQFTHQMVADVAGGTIITWEDRRTGRDIYTQRINAAGAAQWTANGIPVCNTGDTQEEPQIIARTTGGAIIIWTDSRNSFQQDIYAQKIDAAGAAAWTANGVPVANEANAQFSAQLLSDGADGGVVVWTDLRSALDYDIYSSRLFSSGLLPLQLISFSGTTYKNDALLTWVTENELNSSHFDIDFSSDGIIFTKLATVIAKNSAGKNQYSFTHFSPQDNILYYRLKQVDADAKFNYSHTLKLTLNRPMQLVLYPNPASNFIQLKNITASEVQEIIVTAIDGSTVMLCKPGNHLRYDISHLTNGMYLLKLVKKDNSISVIQFIKQ
jgi:hypothetical protein